jgi:hypothetical protein
MMAGMPDYDALARELLREPGVEAGTGFGATPGLRLGGKIFVMHMDGDLVVKLPADRAAAVAEAGGRPLQIGTRTMREWVRVGPGPDWPALAREALASMRG